MQFPLFLVVQCLSIDYVHAYYPFSVPASCGSSQFLSTVNLQCISCPANSLSLQTSDHQFNPYFSYNSRITPQSFSTAFVDRQLTVQTSPCVCSPNFFATTFTPLVCTACPVGQVARSDQSLCLSCDASTSTLDTTLGDCICNSNTDVLIEISDTLVPITSKFCRACPPNSYKSTQNRYECITCGDSLMTGSTCDCPSTHTKVLDRCLLNTQLAMVSGSYNSDQWSQITFYLADTDNAEYTANAGNTRGIEVVTVSSSLYNDIFPVVSVDCMNGIYTSCSALVNLCVWTQYKDDHPACQVLDRLRSQSPTVHGFGDWKLGFPFTKLTDSAFVKHPSIRQNVRLRGSEGEYYPGFDLLGTSPSGFVGSSTSKLNYAFLTFSANGTLLTAEPLSTQLSLCPSNSIDDVSFLEFGTEYRNTCELDLPSIATRPGVTHELFLIDSDNQWYPVYVKMLTMVRGANRPNFKKKTTETSDDSSVYVHRFFLIDTTSTWQDTEKVLTFARKVTLRVKMQDGSIQGIYAPILTIEYTSRRMSTIMGGSGTISVAARKHRTSDAFFQQEYRKELNEIQTAVVVLFFIGLVVVIIIWISRIRIRRIKHGGGEVTLGDIIEYITCFLGLSGELLFWLVFLYVTIIFFFYKAQQSVHVLLPSSDSFIMRAFLPVLIVSFACKILHVFNLVYQQLSIDLLFIDWEHVASLHPGLSTSVSLWRKVYAITQFIALQGYRRHHVSLSLIITVFFLEGVGLLGLATAQPDGTNISLNHPISPVLRTFMTALLFLVFAGLQRLIGNIFYGWIWADPTTNFCDLQSNCNVSLVIFDGSLHCFYIHGKSVHGTTNVGIAEFRKQREQERLGWVKTRGQVNEVSNFSVFLTPEMRRVYDNMYTDARNKAIVASLRDDDNAGVQGKVSKTPNVQDAGSAGTVNALTSALPRNQDVGANITDISNSDAIQAARKAEANLNNLWTEFIDKSNTIHKWKYVERTAFSSWLDVRGERGGSSENMSMFCNDSRKNIEDLFLYGLEHDLLILYTVGLIMLEYAFDNTFVGVGVVFVIDFFLTYARRKLGQTTTAKKSLLEDRYI